MVLRTCDKCRAKALYRLPGWGRDEGRCKAHRLPGSVALVYPDETPQEV